MSEEREDTKKVYEAYNKYAEKIWENGYRFNPVYLASKALSDWILLTSVDLRDKQVLNIGCAEPIDEIQFVEKVSRWVALDINEKLIDTAEEIARRKLHPSLFDKLQFIQGDATALDFPDNSFDISVSFSVIEHIPDPAARQKAFKEIARVTKPGGHVIITVPNRYSLFYFAHRRSMRLGISDYGYSYLYTPFELKRLLRSIGLKPIKFASEYSAFTVMPSYFPFRDIIINNRIVNNLLSMIQYLGERIGVLAIKDI